MAWRPHPFRFAGGINIEDPQIVLAAGNVLFTKNYEALQGGGYRRIDGYERFDGGASPSDAVYYKLPFTAGVGLAAPAVGSTVTGGTSGVTSYLLAVETTSGFWSNGTAAGTMFVTNKSVGDYTAGETLAADGTNSTNTAAQLTQSIGDTNYKTYLSAAREYYRSFITKVNAGGGAVIGGFILNGSVYAFAEDDQTPVSVGLYKATASGWSAVTLNQYLAYDNGVGEISEGDTITGLASGATAVVRLVGVGAGNIAGPTFRSGRLAISDVAGGPFQNNEALQISAVTVANADGINTNHTLLPGGRYETLIHNFYGAENLTRAYGCDGVNLAFVFDGTYFLGFTTGMVVDTPSHIEEHRGHIFLSFPGGSVQNSGTSEPLIWSPRLGAAEIGFGDTVTNLRSNGANTLTICGDDSIQLLYGTSNLDWNMKPLTESNGALAYTAQEAGGQTTVLDKGNVAHLVPTNAFGDFGAKPISREIRKIIKNKAPLAIESISLNAKSQYRVLFSDKTALTATFFGTKLMGWMTQTYLHQFISLWQARIGTENRIFGGTEDGYVMEIDSGTSFDGAEIESVLVLPYASLGTPDRDKRFHKVNFEMESPAAIDIRVQFDFDYGASQTHDTQDKTTSAAGGQWDVSVWEQFYWDSPVVAIAQCNIKGVGQNVNTTIYHSDAVDEPFTLHAESILYSMWGNKR